MRRAVFLDRDGVINRAIVRDGKLYPPASLAELEILPGVRAALDRLRAAGWACVVVTNQPDVARGVQSRVVVEAINARISTELPLDEVRVCYHDDDDRCACRKPQPGLLTREPQYDVRASVMVGDRWRDIEAGRRAGVRTTILVESTGAERCHVPPDVCVPSLVEAVHAILDLPPMGTS